MDSMASAGALCPPKQKKLPTEKFWAGKTVG